MELGAQRALFGEKTMEMDCALAGTTQDNWLKLSFTAHCPTPAPLCSWGVEASKSLHRSRDWPGKNLKREGILQDEREGAGCGKQSVLCSLFLFEVRRGGG